MRKREAKVWHETKLVGELSENARGQLCFSYDASWLESGFPISLNLPLDREEHTSAAHAFFEGLLPEGATRQRLSRQYKLSTHDVLGLLLRIGGDCAGALSVLPTEQSPSTKELKAQPISLDDLERLLQSRGQSSISAAPQRFSIAGAQDKIAVIINNNGLFTPNAYQPSTHIIKFETIRWVCFAEYMAHQLARSLKLTTAEITYCEHEKMPYLRISRYDREHPSSGNIKRLHQEDLAQAMGYPSQTKYEQDGGPSLAQIATVIREHCDQPARDIVRLSTWQIFNYLVGNSDGHAKNLSLLYRPNRSTPELAPFYDLVCIEFLNFIGVTSFDRSLAFLIGEHAEPEQISKEDWLLFAKSIQVPAKTLLETLRHMADELPSLAKQARAQFTEHFADNQVYDDFEKSISKRCRWTLNNTLK
ncbi:MAG: type II toxin-antitoxin system HipA family toxin [Myxococcales bacterium]|nr:MAG: type II toxin-antitoxin system HipA family toxin [Myxococcales bacterium]